jgi:hypothetical protein
MEIGRTIGNDKWGGGERNEKGKEDGRKKGRELERVGGGM